MSLLDVRGLNVRGPAGTLIDDLQLSLDPGERVGLIGESGSGKSLTCLSIMGLLPENLTASGSIRLAGVDHDLTDASERRLAQLRGQRMSMIFQEPMTALNPLMKVGRQVSEIITVHGDSDRRAAADRAVELLDDVGIPDPAVAVHAYPHQLSGGQRQRVMLAMAMANAPDLLLADEPTTALDVTVQAQVLELMRRQVDESDSALLFITHDLALVSGLCERVLIMKDGAVVESGPIDQVFSAPQHQYTQDLMAASVGPADQRAPRSLSPSKRLSPEPVLRQAQDADPAHAVLPEDGAPMVFNPSTEAIVRVRDLSRVYHRGRTSLFGGRRAIPALQGINLDIAPGSRFGIVGESGSGKSTLLRLLSALDSPTAGTAEVCGIRLDGASSRALRALRDQVQIVFQDPHSSLDPRMRVRDVVAEPLRNFDTATRYAKVADLLEAVRLPADAAGRFPHQFSGGQRQRIAIARALITNPSILLADEAVSALDVSVRAQVLKLLGDLIESYHLTLIFVSHDLNVVRQLCESVAVMQAGRIVESGPTEQIFAHPQHPYTQQLIAALPTLERNPT